jgi:metal-responsive CopG/Arc/MetJ family transcriptional regulator
MEGRRRVSISLPDVLSKKMDAATECSGLSASEIVRAALNEYFKKGE